MADEKDDSSTKSFKDDAEERCQEKIIYKIIPVPYYYPVPVDAEWYNKNYEKQFKPNEFAKFPFADTASAENVPPPPPGFPFPGFRHPNKHFVYDPNLNPTTSPPPPSRQENNGATNTAEKSAANAACVPVENGAAKEEAPKKDKPEDKAPETCPPVIIKQEVMDDEDFDSITVVVNGAKDGSKNRSPDASLEERRKGIDEILSPQKRPAMTFPYDQNKKAKLMMNGGGDAEKLDAPKLGASPVPQASPEEHPVSTKSTPEPAPEPRQILVQNPAGGMQVLPAGMAGVPIQLPNGQTATAAYGMQGIPGMPMMIPQGVPYVMVPMQGNPTAFPMQQQPTLQPTIVHQPNISVVEPRPRAPRPRARLAAPPRRLPPPYSMVDTTKLATAELKDMKADMLNWDKETPKEVNPDDVKYHHNGRRVRTVFTRHQLITLNSIFKKQNFISSKRMRELSDELGLDRKTVKIWFQNKRQYLRKKAMSHDSGDFVIESEDYLMYRDIAASEIIHPPTMTSHTPGAAVMTSQVPATAFNTIEANLNIMDTSDQDDMSNDIDEEEGLILHDSSDLNDDEEYNDNMFNNNNNSNNNNKNDSINNNNHNNKNINNKNNGVEMVGDSEDIVHVKMENEVDLSSQDTISENDFMGDEKSGSEGEGAPSLTEGLEMGEVATC